MKEYSGIIIMNKPVGGSSHKCVSIARRALNMKKIGHTGTLDPDASGVLPLLVGKATRVADFLTAEDKSYRAGVLLGTKTDTLDLSGEVIADIFAGEIKTWNDARIAALNPNVKLPTEAIIPVFRSDGSGTTFVFTDYLTKASPMWASQYGTGKSVNFPTGQAAKGNPGVAGVISHTKNAIGYVGSEYAFAQKIPYAKIQNQRGELVEPTSASISAAASGVLPEDTRASITNANVAGAYPIATFTWMIIYKEQNYADRSKEQAIATIDLLQHLLSDEAQSITSEVHYVPLPTQAKELSRKNLKTATYDGVTILPNI